VIYTKAFKIPTARRVDFIDLTPFLNQAVGESGVHKGLAHVILKHTSASISIQEFEPNLLGDFETFLKGFASDDPEVPQLLHNQLWRRPDRPADEPLNADAHIKSLFMGNSRVVTVEGGKPDLGTWQRIILVEMDGPREREVSIMVQGDTALEGFKAYWGEKSQVITAAMAPYLEKQWMGDVLEASRYLMRGGKRIRGVLALLICEALGGDMDKALDAAVAVEMVHASSLAKDDVQDGDEYRRGDLATWAIYGVRKATALVDVTIPHALVILRKYNKEAVDVAIDAWRELGIGQVKDLFLAPFRGRRLYDEVVRGKTGALFSLAATLGAIAAKATRPQKALASRYGRQLGYTFQVMDDLADLEEGRPIAASFQEWLEGIPAKEKVRDLVKETQKLAEEFPESIYRQYLAQLPELALQLMMEEARMAKRRKAELDTVEEDTEVS